MFSLSGGGSVGDLPEEVESNVPQVKRTTLVPEVRDVVVP